MNLLKALEKQIFTKERLCCQSGGTLKVLCILSCLQGIKPLIQTYTSRDLVRSVGAHLVAAPFVATPRPIDRSFDRWIARIVPNIQPFEKSRADPPEVPG
ncbi:hypothetical protein DMN91_008516 [Ooceraea biroi]|uniref:Uncharacterized protein n=1 Tax=Ooceraea biroi TaxID=2015173 RepID=A0A3L8DHR4_OOCBI|nr:hypothetical protein DMN91_008516 [Ooceraea biroi]